MGAPEHEEYAPGVMVGGSGETVAIPRRVRWKVVNLQGWAECQFDGFIAATRHGMDRHEAVFHGSDEGLHHVVAELEGRVYDAQEMLRRLPKRAGLRLWGWGRR